jgi:hypothetical protein
MSMSARRLAAPDMLRPLRGGRSTAAFVLLLTVGQLLATGCSDDQERAENGSPTTSSAGTPPWPAPVDGVPDLVAEAGLDLGPMGMAEHYHPRLRILVEGEEVTVPANIGVDVTTGAMSALHTHETDGTLHIEADTAGEVFTLGQLFTQWGVPLSGNRIGGIETNSGISVTSNGEPVEGDPADLRLQPDQEIVLEVP